MDSCDAQLMSSTETQVENAAAAAMEAPATECRFRREVIVTQPSGAAHDLPEPDEGMLNRDESGVWKCNVCHKILSAKHVLEAHLRTHTGEQPYQCHKCGKCFAHNRNLIMHIRKHNGLIAFKCDVCQKSFVEPYLLKQHALRHTRVKQFQCKLCPKAFKHIMTLKKHLRRVHTSENIDLEAEAAAVDALYGQKKVTKVHECSVCSETFVSKTVYDLHMVKQHGQNQYKCILCSKSFASKVCYKNHMITHVHEKKFKCSCCEKLFYSKANVRIHMRSHMTEKPFKCNLCGNQYSQKHHLRNHLRNHTGERPYACTECNKTFTTLGNLKIHMRVHSGEKPFKCTFCSQAFSVQCTLTSHLRIHTGEKPYKCKFCDKSFIDSSHARRHEKRVHLRKWTLIKEIPRNSRDRRHPSEQALNIHCFSEDKVKDNSSNEHFLTIEEKSSKCLKTLKVPQSGTSIKTSFHKRPTILAKTKGSAEYSYSERPYGCSLCLKAFETKTDTVQHFFLFH